MDLAEIAALSVAEDVALTIAALAEAEDLASEAIALTAAVALTVAQEDLAEFAAKNCLESAFPFAL